MDILKKMFGMNGRAAATEKDIAINDKNTKRWAKVSIIRQLAPKRRFNSCNRWITSLHRNRCVLRTCNVRCELGEKSIIGENDNYVEINSGLMGTHFIAQIGCFWQRTDLIISYFCIENLFLFDSCDEITNLFTHGYFDGALRGVCDCYNWCF